jgi:nitrite reductase/ring-hydroxylating ferredoxin subunit
VSDVPVHLGPAADVPEGGARGYDPSGDGQDTLFAVRAHGTLHLWRDRCPHAGTPMAWRRHAYLNAAGNRIVCAAHGAQFEPDTGLCVVGPCLGAHLQPVAFSIDHGEIVIDPAHAGPSQPRARSASFPTNKETSS